MKRIISSFAAFIFAVSALASAGGVGTTGAQFLKIDPSARPLGIGGAFCGLADDSSAVFYNPAGLAGQTVTGVSGTYLRYFQDINYGSFAAVLPDRGPGTLGIGVNYLGVTDIAKRGTTDVTDITGTASPASTFGAMDTAFSLSYGLKDAVPTVLSGLDLGGSLRMIYQTIDEESSFSAMIDLGALYPVSDKLSMGLAVQNLGSGVNFINETDALPVNVKAGAALRPMSGLIVALDVNEYVIDQILYASLGAEYTLMDMIAFRAGYKYGYDTDSLGGAVGVSGGLGFRYSSVGVDYAFAPFGELGDTHRVTASYRFGK